VVVVERMDDKNKGGRPRVNPPRITKFGEWMRDTGQAPMDVKEALGCGLSTVYALAGGEFMPSRELGWKISELTKGAVPFTKVAWQSRKI
jgi:hypothetical protein